jgi:hypothetical protein
VRTFASGLILMGACLAFAPLMHAQGLVGSQVTLTGDYPDLGTPFTEPNTQTVGPGLEYPVGSLTSLPQSGVFVIPINIDVGANSISGHYTANDTALTASFNGYVFDFGPGSPTITGATIDPSTTFAPGSVKLGFSPHQVTINVEGLTATPASSFLIDLTTTPAPPTIVAKDFDVDGFADLVWQNTSTGQRAIWFLKDGVYSSSISLPTASPQWNIAGVGDFGNGQNDLVLQNSTTGQCAIWLLKDGVYSSSISLPTMPVQWRIVGAGDFAANSQNDLVWENIATGQRAIWFLNNGVLSNTLNLPTVSTLWHIAGTGDFNGDGKADLVLENVVTGQRTIWLMNDGVLSSTINLPMVSTQWHIAGAGDFNGSGYASLAWQNTTTGQRAIWFMKNGVFTGSVNLPTLPLQWSIVDH